VGDERSPSRTKSRSASNCLWLDGALSSTWFSSAERRPYCTSLRIKCRANGVLSMSRSVGHFTYV